MSPESYFDYLEREFRKTSDSPFYRFFNISGETFRLDFPSEKVSKPFTLPFIETSPIDDPDFIIAIWDSKTSKYEKLQPGWKLESYGKRGEIIGFNRDPYRCLFDIGSQSLSMAHLTKKRAFFWTDNFLSLPFWERGAPLRNIIHWLLPLRNKYLVHGAGIGYHKGGILLVGQGGAGKTTTALSSMTTDLLYLGDDYTAIEIANTPKIHTVFTSAKVCPHTSEKLFPKKTSYENEKIVIQLHEEFPDKIATNLPLKAIIRPIITSSSMPSLISYSKSKMLAEFAGSTLFQLPGNSPRFLSDMANLLDSLPCFALKLSSNLKTNAEYLAQEIGCKYVD